FAASVRAAWSVMRGRSRPLWPDRTVELRILIKYRDGADRRAGPLAPLERQADEAELALADQGLEVAQALHVRDVELEAGLVHERVDDALRARPHRVDAEVHDALAREPLGRRDVDARIVGRIGRRREGTRVVARAQQHRAALRD